MNEQLRRGVESESLQSGEVLKNKSSYLVGKLKKVASSVAAVLAFAGVQNEAMADTGTVDDITFDRSLNSSDPLSIAPLLDMKNVTFSLEKSAQSGGEVEINNLYSARINFSSNLKTLEFVDSVGSIVETHNFPGNINEIVPVISLGMDYFILKTSGKVYVFKGADIGSSNGVIFRESSRSVSPNLVTHLNKHPQTGDLVGATMAGGQSEPAIFFSYGLGDFTSSHPVSGSEVLVDQALQSIGVKDSNGVYLSTSYVSSVMPNGDVYFAYQDSNGDYQQWINPESDEVVAPTPVISAPAEFTMNVADMIAGKKLEINVKDVPANGSVVLELAGEVFEMSSVGNGDYELVFVEQDLKNIQGGEFDEVAVAKVLDESGAEVATASLDASVDIVNPNAIEFGIDGAEIQTIGGVDVHIVESEEIPAEITLNWAEGALSNLAAASVAVASIPLPPGMSMSDFASQTDQEKIDFVMGNVDTSRGDEGGMIVKSGSLGVVKPIDDLSVTSIDVEVLDGPHAVAILGFDEAGNVSVSIEVVNVSQIDNSDMTCAENPEQDKCETPVETCVENPEQEKCETPVETCTENPNQDKCETLEKTCAENPNQDKCETPGGKPDSNLGGGSGSEEPGGGCSVPGENAPVDGGLTLGALGMLGLAGVKRRRKRKIPKSSK